jgi:multiple sugar transport system permease protein
MFQEPPTILPEHPTLLNYEVMTPWTASQITQQITGTMRMEIWRLFINSIGIAISAAAIVVVVGSIAAYGFSRFRFRGKMHLLSFIFITYLLPAITIIFPLFIMFRTVHLLDTWPALILTYVSYQLPFIIWLLFGYFQELPVEVEEAALVDGCSRLQSLFRVTVPLATPGLAVSAFLTFVSCWNEFLYALSFTFSPAAETLPLIVASFQTSASFQWGMLLATGSVIALPSIILALFAQRWMVRGLSLGATKG